MLRCAYFGCALAAWNGTPLEAPLAPPFKECFGRLIFPVSRTRLVVGFRLVNMTDHHPGNYAMTRLRPKATAKTRRDLLFRLCRLNQDFRNGYASVAAFVYRKSVLVRGGKFRNHGKTTYSADDCSVPNLLRHNATC